MIIVHPSFVNRNQSWEGKFSEGLARIAEFLGGNKVYIEPHRHEGVFIAKGKEDQLVTRNLVPGDTVYGEKRVSVEVNLELLHFFTFFDSYLLPSRLMEIKLNIEYGILSVLNWLLLLLVVLPGFIFNPGPKFYI